MKKLSAVILGLGCLAIGYASGAGVENLLLDPENPSEYAQLVGAAYLAGATLAAVVTTWALLRLRRRGAETDTPEEADGKSTAQLLAELDG